MKYYAYYRVSTEVQAEKGYGLEVQRQEIEKYAKAHNIEITEFFHDDGVSGTDPNRVGLTDLLATLNKDDKVIVLNTSRLWRNDTVKVLVHHSMKKVNADIISIEQDRYSIYTKDPTEVLFNGMLELLDLYSRLEINMKLSKGRRTKAVNGSKACGTAPYGYRWNTDAEIEIDYNNHLVVIDIFEKYLELGSLGKLQKYTIEKGYKTRHGKDFSKQALSNILHNDFYIGYVTHGDIKVRANHEPIITEELYSKVNNIKCV